MKTLIAILLVGATMCAADFKDDELKVKKIALFSSGVGFYELGGEIKGASKIALPFTLDQMNDALKSLTIYDSASVAPFVGYPSEETIKRTLESLRVNLRGEPTIENILSSLKGESVEIAAPQKLTGKIVGVQTRQSAKEGAAWTQSVLTLYSGGALRQIAISEIESYRFTDAKINAEFEKALSFLANANNGDRRVLNLYLDGTKKREVRASFVIAAPVWKANYRLDLGAEKPFLQGWAIIDNASDSDWEDVELSLAVGRPVSFIQPYYAPFYTRRPELPLSIAGFAAADTRESGFKEFGEEALYEVAAESEQSYMRLKQGARAASVDFAPAPASVAQNYQTASAKTAGEQFIYTLKNKITLARRQSAMAPLTQGAIEARKVLIFNAAKGQNPALGVELTNSLGAKLPAGAITVYDDGIYAGDALLEFLPQKEKRLINYGEDLSARGIVNQHISSTIDSVKISKGVIRISSKRVDTKEYIFKNGSESAKTLILEHPIVRGAKLIEPNKPAEKTDSLYRFELSLAANKETAFTVKEEQTLSNSTTIAGQPFSALAVYINNDDYPAKIRNALKKAEPLAAELEKQRTRLRDAQSAYERQTKEQERIRANLVAVGADSAQGKNYAARLVDMDKEIEATNKS
ncbi:MAG: DUF4139 domain-containing protein, partial [Helicobacteraceae bacterium]|nr:DUF4139 domain-containing protein [Helicobacteraceae bacterium]